MGEDNARPVLTVEIYCHAYGYTVNVPELRSSFISDSPVWVTVQLGTAVDYSGSGYCLDLDDGLCVVAESAGGIALGFNPMDHVNARHVAGELIDPDAPGEVPRG